MQNLNGKRVVITGGSQGLGLSVLSTCVTKQTKDMRYSEAESR
jgi:NAD(P)-dependent dehydrogenase (short-subunit alcohol dehydrogenase family)